MKKLTLALKDNRGFLLILTIAIIASLALSMAPIQIPLFRDVFRIGMDGVAYGVTLDAVCDGIDDDIQVQAILSDNVPLTGGEIILLAGAYDFQTTVFRHIDNVKISGSGAATIITTDDADEAPFNCEGDTGWTFEAFACDDAPLYTQSSGVTTDTVLNGIWIGGVYTVDLPPPETIVRTATLVVAGSNADSQVLAQADFVCDADQDEVEINAAIAALPTRTSICTVKLIGHFHPALPVVLDNYTRLDLTEASFDWTYYHTSGVGMITATGTLETVTPAPTAITVNPVTGDIYVAADSSANFAVDDYVIIRHETAAVGTKKDGEIHRITRIIGNNVYLDTMIWRPYTTATLQKINMMHDIEIDGGEIVGTTATDTNKVSATTFTFVAEFKIKNMKLKNVPYALFSYSSCVNGDVSGNRTWGSATDGMGYANVFYGACNQINTHDNEFKYVRHGFTGNGSATYYGSPMYLTFQDNLVIGNRDDTGGSAMIDLHTCNAWGIRFLNNVILGGTASTGFNVGAMEWEASGNIITCYYWAFNDRNDDAIPQSVKYVTLRNNHVLKGGGAMLNSPVMERLIIDGLIIDAPTYEGVEIDFRRRGKCETGTNANTLIDANAAWVVGDVGKAIHNLNDSTSTTVATFVSASEITTTDDIFDVNEYWYIARDPNVGYAQVSGVVVRNAPSLGAYEPIAIIYVPEILVTNNNVRDSGTNGLYISGAISGLVNNNVVSDSDTNDAGIYLGSCNKLLVEGNTCYDDQAVATQKYGIREGDVWPDTSDNNTIRGNKLRGNVTAGILKTGAATTVRDNDGFVTENSGASSGTGSQQTIAHGLAFTPTRQQISLTAGTATANPYHSAAPDATNIYVTAANGQAWYWATNGT